MKKKKKAFGKYLVADPEICHGKLTFKSTRILVADVLDLVARGYDWKYIVRQCHNRITSEAVAGAVQLAGKAFFDHADEYLRESVSS